MKKLYRAVLLLSSVALFVSCAAQRGPVSLIPKNPVVRGGTFDVRDYGAKGDGTTNDTVAFQKALDACNAVGGGKVFVANGYYLIGSIVIGANTTLQLADHADIIGSPDIADYPVIRIRWEGEFVQGHRALIFSENAANVAITGRGAIFGPPISVSHLRNPRGPALIEFSGCTNVTLDGFSTQYQQLWSIHPLFCEKFTARNLTIRSINPNGDGIDVDSCNGVLIENCNIDTGDDSISLKSGRGESAIALARPTQDVVIRNCTLVSSIFGALGIGSELSGGIHNVRVENCTISGHQNGIFFKSRDGRGGSIENFTGENLTIYNSPTFLAVNLLSKGVQASDPVTNGVAGWTKVDNIRFSNVLVENVSDLVLAQNIPPEQPLDGLAISNVTGVCSRAFRMANITNATLAAIKVTGYRGEFITQTNVQGSGLEAPK
jgi:polygalacturonase